MSLGKRVRRTLYDPYLSVFLARSDGEVYEMGEGLPLLPLFPCTEALPHYSLCKIAKNDNFLRIAKLYHFSNIRYFFEPVLAKKNLTGSKEYVIIKPLLVTFGKMSFWPLSVYASTL